MYKNVRPCQTKRLSGHNHMVFDLHFRYKEKLVEKIHKYGLVPFGFAVRRWSKEVYQCYVSYT